MEKRTGAMAAGGTFCAQTKRDKEVNIELLMIMTS